MTGDDDLLTAWGYRPDREPEPPSAPSAAKSAESAERRRLGPGGPIDLAFQEKRGLIAALVFLAIHGVFTGVQAVAFLHFGDDQNMHPGYARAAVLINVVVLATFILLLTTLLALRMHRGRPSRRATAVALHLAIFTVFSANLMHMHLGGTQHTFLPLANLGVGLVAAWLLGMRASWAYYVFFSLAYLGLSMLEMVGALPYAPLFVYGDELGRNFTDGRFIAFNYFLYCTVSLIVMTAIGLFERDRDRRGQMLREATDAAKRAISQVHELQKLIPMCSSCKKVRNDEGFWRDVSHYMNEMGQGLVSHGICPECTAKLYPDLQMPETTKTD
ncbi:MAG: hypothetical protein KJ042_03300 [Deltaproteobacteria bacterium]|nr:hypothetical protein [Deltaproteobacteria bacterium]